MKLNKLALSVIGAFLVPAIWIGTKAFFSIDDRYLPSLVAVVKAIRDIEPSLLLHTAYTAGRLAFGSALGIVLGIGLGLLMHRSPTFCRLAMPGVQSMRAVPPLATVPFFLLWFGFSETGRYLMIVAGIGFNIAIATYQIAEDIPEKYRIFFSGLQVSPRRFIISFALPRVIEVLLPTVRFSIATATGLVIVSELLGSQVGLGYLMQSARSTFATHTIFLSAIVLGFLGAAADALIRFGWRYLVFWRESPVSDYVK